MINYFIVMCIVILFDQLTKYFALVNQAFVANEGMLFGSFSDTSAVIRISLITSGSIIFFIIYFFMMFFLSDKLKILKMGISFLFGGAISNAIDKVYLNFVVDFIPISFGDYIFYANVSDIIQLFGVGIILYYIFLCQDDIWFPDDKRGVILVSPSSQIKFALKFFIVCICSLLMISLFSFTYMDFEFAGFIGHKKTEFVVLAIMLSTIFGMLIFIFGIYLSHHFYGPIYKLNKYVNNDEWEEKFVLRENDQFKELEKIISSLKKRYIHKS